MRHNEGGEHHKAENDGVSSHTDLEKEIVDVGISEEMVKEVGVVDGDSSDPNPKCTSEVK